MSDTPIESSALSSTAAPPEVPVQAPSADAAPAKSQAAKLGAEGPAWRGFAGEFWRFLGGYPLAVGTLVLLCLVTWLGTKAQVELGLWGAIQKYFGSKMYFIEYVGPLGIPLPSATLLLWILTVNLIVGGVIRIRKTVQLAGIYIAHAGILMLIAGGFYKDRSAYEGHLVLPRNVERSVFLGTKWELAITEKLDGDKVREHLVDPARLHKLGYNDKLLVRSAGLPFDVHISGFAANSRVYPEGRGGDSSNRGTAIGGYQLAAMEVAKEEGQSMPGCYVTILGDGKPVERAIVHARSQSAWAFDYNGKRYSVDLRQRRHRLPFSVTLDKFVHDTYANLPGMHRAFESHIRVKKGGDERAVKIEMNDPLRLDGYVLYQTDWGPKTPGTPNDKKWSVLTVSWNPADRWPEWACYIIGIGLFIHFLLKLIAYLQRETASRARAT